MRWPVDINQYPITQKFGENPDMYKKFGLLGHNGIDIGCPTGTKILAPISGKVIEATNDPSGYGLYIKIENNFEGSVLAHNQNFLVKVGDIVSEGQEIAISNNTGNSTGDHCHWGYYKFPRDRSNGYAGFIDQSSLISAIQPQPLAINDQTIIDLGQYGKLEVQAIKGKMGDLDRIDKMLGEADIQISSLQKQLSDCQNNQNKVNPAPITPVTEPITAPIDPQRSIVPPAGFWAFIRALFPNSK